MSKTHSKREKIILCLDYQRQGFFIPPFHASDRIGLFLQTAPTWSIAYGRLSQDPLFGWTWQPSQEGSAFTALVEERPSLQIREIHVFFHKEKENELSLVLVQQLIDVDLIAITPLTQRPAGQAERFRTYVCDAPFARSPQERLHAAKLAAYRYYYYHPEAPPKVQIHGLGITGVMGIHEYFYTFTLDGTLRCQVFEQADGRYRVTTERDSHAEWTVRRAVLTAACKYFGWQTMRAMRVALPAGSSIVIIEEPLPPPSARFGHPVERLWQVRIGDTLCFVVKRITPRGSPRSAVYQAQVKHPLF